MALLTGAQGRRHPRYFPILEPWRPLRQTADLGEES